MKDPKVDYMYQKRKDRICHPDGRTDKGKWFPSEEETCSCCRSIRRPSNAYPWSLAHHCRTRPHLKALAAEKPAYFKSLFNEELWDLLAHPENIALHINSENESVRAYIETTLKKE